MTLTYFTAWSNFVTLAFLYEKVYFQKTIAACDLKLIELMEIWSIEGQGHFLSLAQDYLHMKIKLASLSNHGAIFSQILNVGW